VFLKVKEKTSLLILECYPKWETRYCETFKILEKKGPVAYMLAFPASMRVYNVFNVSLLKKCVPGPNHIIDWNVIQVQHERDFWEEPLRILDQKVKVLRNKSIGLVKVQWTFYNPEDDT
jgi:hypothetical protein